MRYIPEKLRSESSIPSYIPFIFTQSQIKTLLIEALNLSPKNSRRPYTYYTLLGLLYTTGLRIAEALSLNICDLYQNPNRLHIRKGKFRKARWIPLSSSTYSKLIQYIDRCQRESLIESEAPLFTSLQGERLRYRAVNKTFHTLLKRCGLLTSKSSKPRIHSIRHTFAVHRLLEWYHDGQDINIRLPMLSTYMGHVSIHSTQVYLHATSELLEEANQRFLTYFRTNIANGGEHG